MLAHATTLRSLLRLAFVAAFVGLSPLSAAAFDEAANLKDDIRFSRDLARWRFFDLAVDWLAQIEKRPDLDPDLRIEVMLAKATISRLASENALTDEARKKFYDEAIRHYREALDSMGPVMTRRKAEAIVDGLASVLLNKGTFYAKLYERIREEGGSEEQANEARLAAEEAFKEAVRVLNAAYSELVDVVDAAPEEEQKRLRDLTLFALYRKGEAYYRWALLYPEQEFSREDYLTKAKEALVDYLWEAGDESIWALWAYYYQGLIDHELARIRPQEATSHDESALASLFFIVGEYGIDFSQLPGLGDAERDFVLGLAEQAYAAIARIYREAARRFESAPDLDDTTDLSDVAFAYQLIGDEKWQLSKPVFRPALVQGLRNAAVHFVDELIQKTARHGLEPTEEGWRARLEKALTLIDAGRTSEALVIVKEVAEKNEGNAVGRLAQKMLGDLLEEAPAGEQPPSVLRLAMDGLLQEERWLDAIAVGHDLIRACRSEEDQRTYVPQAWKDIGSCYLQLGRFLEAALAFEEGFEAAMRLGDDEAQSELALEAYNAWDRRYRETKDPFDQKQRNRVRDLVTRLGASSDIQFLVAREAFSNAVAEKDPAKAKAAFEKAIRELDKVGEDSTYYERALVLKARALAGAGKPEQAIAVFDSLLERAREVGVAHNKKLAAQRGIALAECHFYKAQVLLDLGKYADVLATLEGFEENYPTRTAFFPAVSYFRVRALVGLGRPEEAEKVLAEMETKYPKDRTLPYAFNSVALGYFEAYRTAEDPQSKEALAKLRKAAEYLERYNQLTGYRSFQNARNVADWYKILGEYELAADAYARLLERFGKNPAYRRTIDQEVKRDYADVLLELRRFQDALPLWREVYQSNRRNREIVRKYALCLGGWLEEKENRGLYEYIEVPGAGQYEEAMNKWQELKKGIEDAGDKLSPDWWEAVTNFFYCAYQLSKQKPEVKQTALKVIANYKALYPDLGGDGFKRKILRIERALQ